MSLYVKYFRFLKFAQLLRVLVTVKSEYENFTTELAYLLFLYVIFIRHYSQQNTTQIKEKKKKGQRQIYTVVAHINVSHEQIG